MAAIMRADSCSYKGTMYLSERSHWRTAMAAIKQER